MYIFGCEVIFNSRKRGPESKASWRRGRKMAGGIDLIDVYLFVFSANFFLFVVI